MLAQGFYPDVIQGLLLCALYIFCNGKLDLKILQYVTAKHLLLTNHLTILTAQTIFVKDTPQSRLSSAVIYLLIPVTPYSNIRVDCFLTPVK
jgi:hypothetical protein